MGNSRPALDVTLLCISRAAMGRDSALIDFLLFIGVFVSFASAATYIVGDSQGWTQGVSYTTWAAKHKFQPGDVLVFRYGPSHTVLEVSQASFKACSTSSPINSLATGNDSITLSSTSSAQYFICGVPGHCQNGMALQVNIVAAAAPAPVLSPPPVSTPTTPVATPVGTPSGTPPTPVGTPPTPVSTPSGTPSTPESTPPPPENPTGSPPASAPTKNLGSESTCSLLVSLLVVIMGSLMVM